MRHGSAAAVHSESNRLDVLSRVMCCDLGVLVLGIETLCRVDIYAATRTSSEMMSRLGLPT